MITTKADSKFRKYSEEGQGTTYHITDFKQEYHDEHKWGQG